MSQWHVLRCSNTQDVVRGTEVVARSTDCVVLRAVLIIVVAVAALVVVFLVVAAVLVVLSTAVSQALVASPSRWHGFGDQEWEFRARDYFSYLVRVSWTGHPILSPLLRFCP